MPKFVTKNALSGLFCARLLKSYCPFWNQHLHIYQIAKFREKTKMTKFGTKNVLIGNFWARISKSYCHIWNQHTKIWQIAKFREKSKVSKFASKNAWCWYFCGRILMKSAPSNLSNCKILQKNPKMAKYGNKNPLFGYCWG